MAAAMPAPFVEASVRIFGEGEYDDAVVLDTITRVTGSTPDLRRVGRRPRRLLPSGRRGGGGGDGDDGGRPQGEAATLRAQASGASGLGLWSLNWLPEGSASRARRPYGVSSAGSRTVAPNSTALAIVAWMSSTAK